MIMTSGMQISLYQVTLFHVAHAGLEKSKTRTDLAISMPPICQLRWSRLTTAISCPALDIENQHEGMGGIDSHNILCRLLLGKNDNTDKKFKVRFSGIELRLHLRSLEGRFFCNLQKKSRIPSAQCYICHTKCRSQRIQATLKFFARGPIFGELTKSTMVLDN